MMGAIRCYGYSDDTAIIEGSVSSDKYCFNKGDSNIVNATAHIKDSNGEGCKVVFAYAGTWAIGIAQFDDEEPIPPRVSSATFVQGQDMDSCGHSVVLNMDIPDDAKITWEGEK